ncbi:MAG: FAD-dependent monooxygenase [Actinobacteria bacterium]|nr:FAD-dependent monooxygenase [Actinomycetota bacterium]
MRVACVGGGPGGLFFSLLFKQSNPASEVVVFERNSLQDFFGFGVVFSDATLGNLSNTDSRLCQQLDRLGEHWERIEVRLKGERLGCGGNGMAAITRKELLALLQQRAMEVGVDLRAHEEVRDLSQLSSVDLIVVCDGVGSRLRSQLSRQLYPSVEVSSAKYIWFGTTYRFEGLTFIFEPCLDGLFAVHGYPIDSHTGTFIVETDELSWHRAGLDKFDLSQAPSRSDEVSRVYLEKLFSSQIDGCKLLTNNSRWASFRTVSNRSWHWRNVVLLGDAAHSAHFSVGSGTKMAMEDAAALVRALDEHPKDLESALVSYESERRPSVEHIQSSARPSLAWWENYRTYYDSFEPAQFAFHFLSRSIGYGRILKRDKAFVDQVISWWARRYGDRDPLCSPLHTGSLHATSRLVRLGESSERLRLPGGSELARVSTYSRAPQGPWALDIDASGSRGDLAAAMRAVETAGCKPSVAVVSGGDLLERVRACESIRLIHHLPVLAVEDSCDLDRARTLLLSGRADLVGLKGQADMAMAEEHGNGAKTGDGCN